MSATQSCCCEFSFARDTSVRHLGFVFGDGGKLEESENPWRTGENQREQTLHS